MLEARPKDASSRYRVVLFYIERKKLEVMRALVVENDGTRRRFDFFDPDRNAAIPKAEFLIAPP